MSVELNNAASLQKSLYTEPAIQKASQEKEQKSKESTPVLKQNKDIFQPQKLSINSIMNKDLIQFVSKKKTSDSVEKQKLNINLDLNFSISKLKQNVEKIIDKDNIQDNGEKKFTPFLETEIKTAAKKVKKEPVAGNGNGSAADVRVKVTKTSTKHQRSHYRLDKIKLQIQRRQSEKTSAALGVQYRNGYRKVYYKLSQRYSEDVSLNAELLNKFNNVTQDVAQKQPESTEKFLNTTEKLVDNKNVSGKNISRFFDVVDSYVNKAEEALHSRIDTFLDNILKNFDFDPENINRVRERLHNSVDDFFDNVGTAIDMLESGTLESISAGESADKVKAPAENEPVTTEIQPEEQPEDQEINKTP